MTKEYDIERTSDNLDIHEVEGHIDNLNLELSALRRVYEAARRVQRFSGVDIERVNEALDDLDDAIEVVKQIDGGTYEVDLRGAARRSEAADRIGSFLSEGLKSRGIHGVNDCERCAHREGRKAHSHCYLFAWEPIGPCGEFKEKT